MGWFNVLANKNSNMRSWWKPQLRTPAKQTRDMTNAIIIDVVSVVPGEKNVDLDLDM